jgi:hypothetical protein
MSSKAGKAQAKRPSTRKIATLMGLRDLSCAGRTY